MSEAKPENPVKEPKKIRTYRAVRGGRWRNSPRGARAAHRSHDLPLGNYDGFGFRIARTKK